SIASVTSASSRLIRVGGLLGNSNLGAKAAKHLGQFQPDVAAAENKEVLSTISRSRVSIWVSGVVCCKPGISKTLARVPVLTITLASRRIRVRLSFSVTSMVLGTANRPLPITSSAPLDIFLFTGFRLLVINP